MRYSIIYTLALACMSCGSLHQESTRDFDSTLERNMDDFEYRKKKMEKTLSSPTDSSAFMIPLYINFFD